MTAAQRARVLEIAETTPWGDIVNGVKDVELALRLALEATREEFLLWERELADARFVDEFSVAPHDVSAMPFVWRVAYVARLLRSAALAYGLYTEFSQQPLGTRREGDGIGEPLWRLLEATDPRGPYAER